MNKATGTLIVKKVALVVSMSMLGALVAQIGAGPLAGQDAVKTTSDRKIAAALQQISATRIQADIEKLVSFGTRLTLSAQDSAAVASGRGLARRGNGSRANLSCIQKNAAAAWK